VISALHPARRSRRTFLLAGAAVLGSAATGFAGCTAPGGPVSPQAPAGSNTGGPTASTATGSAGAPQPGQPSVATFPGSVEGATVEDRLADHAATVLAVGTKDLGKKGRALVTAIRDQHRAHAAALRTADPTDPGSAHPPASDPSPSDSPSGKRPGFAQAVDRLVSAESKAAATHRATALAAQGLPALLWGSLATSAAAISTILKDADLAGDDPDPGATTVAAVKRRAPMPVVSIVAAEQEMVRQLHAVIYGYQLALGRLTGRRRDTAAAELKRHRILRDRLTTRLINRKADVPVAEPAYVPSTSPRNAATAGKLIRQMETALVPFCGLWLAAADTSVERTEALDQVGRTGRVARQWGAALPAWPGWKLS
jgi:Domain of unknown function (DUF4439)